jgi:hypothetical protein
MERAMNISRRTLITSVFLGAGLIACTASRATEAEKTYEVEVLFPPNLTRAKPLVVTDGYSIDVQGNGSITGIGYTVPAHSDADIRLKLKVFALTSAAVEDMNNLIKGMLTASQYEKVRDYEATHASANLSYWGFWGGGGSASYDKTHEVMKGFGLSEENQRAIIAAMSENAKKMSEVDALVHVKNAANNYAVAGSMILYTISGTVTSGNQQSDFRMLANKGTMGTGSKTAEADLQFVPPSN